MAKKMRKHCENKQKLDSGVLFHGKKVRKHCENKQKRNILSF